MLEDQPEAPEETAAASAAGVPAQPGAADPAVDGPGKRPGPASGAEPGWPPNYPDGYAVVDVETTGLARHDRIVSAAVYLLDGRGEVEDHWYSPVNPERDPGPTWIHGLTSEVLADAPLFADIADDFAACLKDRVLVAHNALFDWMMIAREYARAERTAPVRQRLCTIALSKELSLPLPNHKLESLAAHYGVTQRRAHHALDDARVLAEAFRPSLHLAAGREVRLPLLACRPLSEWSDPAVRSRSGLRGVPGSGGGARPPAARSSAGSDGVGGEGAGPSGAGTGVRAGAGASAGDAVASGAAFRSTGLRTSGAYGRGWRPARKRPACPYPNPGRYEPGGRLVQGMRVAISGDTSVDRELLEDRAVEAGLHIATSVSRLTSLLITNDPEAATSKISKARAYGTPVLDEAAFSHLLRDVAPAPAEES
jgi:DNA polymerase III subunit epsilon